MVFIQSIQLLSDTIKQKGYQMRKLIVLAILVAVLLGTIAASTGIAAYYLRGNQSITLVCKGDEFIIQQYSPTELYITCRVWLLR